MLAVEWGYGRRTGLLSNIHLGARDPDAGGFVMVGKTFKGMTDEMLRWQTKRFTELTIGEGPIGGRHAVHLAPEQVVEIAVDGVQASTTYPGGVALRFARVKRYRDDKTAAQADTIDAVQSAAPATVTSWRGPARSVAAIGRRATGRFAPVRPIRTLLTNVGAVALVSVSAGRRVPVVTSPTTRSPGSTARRWSTKIATGNPMGDRG